MVAEGYSEPMLSNRLQGAEVKEGLVITIYLKHLRDSPELSIPACLPRAILSVPEKALNDRLAYLN